MLNVGVFITSNQNIYEYVLLFFMYSFVGWFLESAYMSFCNRKLTNRGFIRGPLCPIYGIGEFIIYHMLYPYSSNYAVLFIMGAVLATVFEFLTAKLMIKLFGYVWWDYTNKPLNYKGIICMESSLGWGIYILIEFAFIHNFMSGIVHSLNIFIGAAIAAGLMIYYLIDFKHSINNIRKGDVTAEENNLLAVTPKK